MPISADLHQRPSAHRRLALVAAALFTVSAVVVPATRASAAPTLAVVASGPGSILQGGGVAYTLRACNTSGPDAYNASFRAVLPAGVTYASTTGTTVTPRSFAQSPSIGFTTLVWDNVADLQTNVCQSIGFNATVNATTNPVGSVLTVNANGYANTDPRKLVKFTNGVVDPTTAPGAGTAAPVNTTVIPYRLTKAGGGELVRGTHNQSSFTLTLTNNQTAPTETFVVDDFLPPNLELLGCTTTDNTTGIAVEYAGAARLTPAACVYSGPLGAPTVAVTTLDGATSVTRADGTSSTPPIGTTWVRWTFPSLDQLPAGGVETITYRAAIPLRENRPFPTTPTPPTAASGQQGANLNNNTGPFTEEAEVNPSTDADGAEQTGTNIAKSGATYNGPRVSGAPTVYGDSASSSFQAEDLAMGKVSAGSVVHGQNLTNTLTVRTGEYRRVDNLTITDRMPNGTCPQGMLTPIDAGCTSANPPTVTVNGTPVTVNSPFFTSVAVQGGTGYRVTWDSTTVPALASIGPNSTVVVTFSSKVRKTYLGGGAVLTNDDLTNYSYVNGQEFKETASGAPAASLGAQPDGQFIQDDASAPVAGISLELSKKVSVRTSLPAAGIPITAAAGDTCAKTTAPTPVLYVDGNETQYSLGDVSCFKLRAKIPANISAAGVKVVDFLPRGIRYIPGSARFTTANTVAVPNPTTPAGLAPQPNVFAPDSPDTSATYGGGTLEWPIGDVGNVTGTGEIFEVTIATEMVQPLEIPDNDLVNNLLKLVSTNTAGTLFNQRAEAGAVIDTPIPLLTKGVDKVQRPRTATPTYPTDYDSPFVSTGADQGDATPVMAFDQVTYRVDVTNQQTLGRDLTNTVVWDKLPLTPSSPHALTCTDVSSGSISDGGTCVSAPFAHIEWTIGSLAPSATKTLRFRVRIPNGITSGSVEKNEAGITSYQYPVNTVTTTHTYVPATNLDPSLPSNLAVSLNDSVNVIASSPSMTKTVTAPTCVGVGCVPTARIGDPVSYVVTADVPRTNIIDGHLLDAVPSNLTDVTWTAKLERDGVNITAGNLTTTSGSGNSIDVPLADPFDNTVGVGIITRITLTINARVANVAPNVDGLTVTNKAQFSSRPTVGGTPVVRDSPNADIKLIVPNVTIAKAIAATSPARLPQPGVLATDTITYELTLTNSGTGRAYRVGLNDVVPAKLTPNVSSILVDGAAVSGADSASFTGQTLNAVIDQIDAGASKKIRYTVIVDSPVTPSPLLTAGLTNTATLTTFQTLPTDPTNPRIRVVTPNTSVTKTVYPLAKVGDLVWSDVNGNGVRDAGDNGLAIAGGVTVKLTGTDILGNTVSRTTTSNAATGAYLFDQLMPSNASGYVVEFVRPSGLYFSPPSAPTTPLTSDTDSDAAIGNGKTAAFVVKSNDNITTVDAGLYVPAVIGDFVWIDLNADGIQDSGETGLAGATVSITDSSGLSVKDGLGATIGALTTTSTGAYTFGALPPGTYQIKVLPPVGYSLSPNDRLSDDTVDSDVTAATNRTGSVTVAAGETNNTLDAGFFRAVTIGDKVWIDLNANGVQNAGDTGGVSGVTVTLAGAGLDGSFGTADDIAGTATTNASGVYSFTKSGANNTGAALPPGTYHLTFTLPATYEFSPASAGGAKASGTDSDANASTGLTPDFTMANNESTTAIDAGMWKRASIGDFVWEDLNANGVQDVGESGVSGVGIELLDSTGASLTVPLTTSTNGSGAWSFTNLVPGDYRIKFTPPVGGGWQFSPTGAGTAATDSNPVPTTGVTAAVTLNSGVNVTTVDAGIYRFATLGDLVWEDINGNGVQEAGDNGIDGVTVKLLDNAGNPVLNGATPITTVTAGGGLYSFTNLIPGTYKIQVVVQTGWAPTILNSTSATDLTDSDINRTTGVSDPVSLISNQANSSLDGGLVQTVTIGDLVWVDTNGSGVRDSGENGVAGAVLRLLDSAGATAKYPSGTTVSDITTTSTGAYSFTGIAPGSYRVQVITRPSGYELTPGLVTINGATTATDSNIDVATSRSDLRTLTSGAIDNTVDVGVFRPISIGDLVWVDANANGTRDAGETSGVAGATVNLLGAGLDATFATADDITGTITTPAGGTYTFTRTGTNNAGSLLAPGIYRITFTTPATWEFTTASGAVPTGSNTDSDASTTAGPTLGRVADITLTEGQTTALVDAGMFQRATLGNFVWEDTNANGIQDSGEPGIVGATVELLDATGASFPTPVTTTTTIGGAWSFTNLRPADYRVKFTAPAGGGWLFTPTGFGTTASDSNANPLTGVTPLITLNSGVTDNSIDAGLYRFATIGDYVWDDLNGDGVQNSGEPTIDGATVTLTGTTGSGVTISARTATTVGGLYSFANVVPGTYVVTVTKPSGMVVTTRDASIGTDATDSDADANGASPSVVLTSNETNNTIDTGLFRPATIGNRVWHDTNADGIQTAGENGIAGLTVRLVDSANASVLNASGVTVAATTTDSVGVYSFTNLRPGSYRVLVTAPTGYVFTDSFVTTGGATTLTDSNADTNGRSDLVTVISNETNNSIDAGLFRGITIGDRVWDDTNADGIQQNTETTGIGGVTVELRNALGSVVATTQTLADGSYTFTRTGLNNAGSLLREGDYSVRFVRPAGYLSSPASAAAPRTSGLDSDANSTTGVTATFTMPDGTATSHVDAGFYLAASIGDRVWDDTNANGVQDGGEPGLDGVTVELLDTTNAVIGTVTTASGGAYVFTNVAPGTYRVRFAPPTGWQSSPTGRGTSSTDSDASTTTRTTGSITVLSAQNITTVDAGFYRNASLGDRVWEDLNGNGVQDTGEPGVANVRVRLLDASGVAVLDGSGAPVVTSTNGIGVYRFDNLAPGIYKIRIDLPTGFTLTAANVGANTTDSDLNKVTGLSGSTTLGSGDVNLTIDAGIVNLPIISGYVYVDADNDGVRDTGEAPIVGTTITLTGRDVFNTIVTRTATTGADGYYQFTGLEASDGSGYTLTETPPSGYLDGRDTIGTAGGSVSGPAPTRDVLTGIVVGSSTNSSRNNFGELLASSLSGFVYVDVTDDGNRQVGEPGITGVIITLSGTDDLGATVSATTTTASDGSYSFTGLRPGSYSVSEPTQPSGYLDGAERAGTSGGITSVNETITAITLTSGTAATSYLFGEKPTTPVAYTSIRGTVRLDPNANGSRQTGENDTVGGVTITLRDSTNAVVATTVTDSNGNYSFTGIPVGDYSVVETQPLGYGSSSPNTLTFTAPVGGIAGQDFFETTSSLSGHVFVDANADGNFDSGETPLGTIVIRVTGTDVTGRSVDISTTTSVDGSWQIDGLVAGTYSVTEPTQPTSYGDGRDHIGSLGGTRVGTGVGTDAITAINVGIAVNGTAYDFGEISSTASISGRVYLDHNRDANRDPVDGPLAGIVIILRNSSGVEIARTTTGGDGTYRFANLTPGEDYRIDQVTPTGYGRSEHPSTILISALSTSGSIGNDFGDTLSTLSGYVYVDANNNGARNPGETGISGVTITLTGTDANGLAVTRTMLTNSLGAWSFVDLLSGAYIVTETQPTAYVDGRDTAGSVGGTVTDDRIAAIAVPVATDAVNYLFGERQNTTSLAGTVFVDDNANGSIDPGDLGLGGVTVTLRDGGGNAVATAVTNPDGTYVFTDLTPGTYSVVETQPNGYGSSTANTVASIIVPIDGVTGINFGETLATLSGHVYVATTDDGIRQIGETTGISGVTVTLTGTDTNGSVSRTTTTDGTGTYQFRGLLAGTYVVTETQPATYTDATDSVGTVNTVTRGTLGNDTITAVVLAAAGIGIDYDFAETAPATAGAFVAGLVYLDVDANGSLETGDSGLGGWTIELLNNSGTVVATVTTAANGTYRITNLGTNNSGGLLPAGVYSIRETQKTTHGSSTPNLIANLNVPPTGRTDQNFGETLSSVAGRVVIDTNNDGIADPGETGIGGVTITLSGNDALGIAVSRTTTTAADGTYSFMSVPAGGYSITETQPSAYDDGNDHIGTVNGTPRGTLVPTDTINAITLPASTASVGVGYDFGETVRPVVTGAVLSGTVFIDRNRSGGSPESGEPGIGGVTLSLYNALGALVATTVTASDGTYSFAGLRPGTYRVDESQPTGLGSTTPNTLSALSVLATGLTNVNFGEIGSSLAGQVYVDTSDDGIRQAPGEVAIAGVTISLTGTDANNAAVTRTTTTATDGTYRFDDLLSGTYTINELQPASHLDGKDAVGVITGPSPSSSPGTLGNDVISAVALPVDGVGTGYDFGEKLRPTPAGTAFLQGIVWVDVNSSTTIDSGETGLGGVLITLRDSTTAIVATALTGTDGRYRFSGLAVGTYSVTETQPSGYTSTTPDVIATAVVPATGLSDQNFGEKLTTGVTGSRTALSGTVWIDANADAVVSVGERGLGGVVLTLLNSSGDAVSTTTTRADGSYVFTNLVPGVYSVSETQPAAYGSSTPNILSTLTVPAAGLTGVDFGETAATISGFVYIDADNNGAKAGTPAEHGIGGTTVNLAGVDVNGIPVSATTTSSPDGSFSFAGLAAGTYTVTEAQPAGYADGIDTAGTTGTAGADVITGIVAPAGGLSTGHLFGELETLPTTVFVRGTIFIDRDRNGAPSTGDLAFAGVTVSLRDAGGALVGTFVTGADGTYLFTGLTPGAVYSVTEVQPLGYGSSLRPTNTETFTAPATGGLSGIDFGDTLSSLAGSVYVDVNGDGDRDVALGSAEVGIGGVTITITGTTAAGQSLSRTTITSPNGSYLFADLPSGIYTVTETQLSPWTDGLDRAGTAGGSVGNDVLADITLPVDTIATGYLFGERTTAAAVTTTLSGFVYVDRGADGRTANSIKDTGEPGVLGVTIILRDVNGTEVNRTTTLADGSYSFTGVTPGTYTVEELQPVNYGSSTPNILSTLTVPTTGLANVNFGETLGVISGTVYSDVNNNGVQDPGEPGISGVRIAVTGRDRENNPVNRFADTLADGTYLVTDLLASDATGYTVSETQPTGWFDGSDASSIHGTIGNDGVTAVVLAPGEQTPVGRFGELAPVAVGDRVWDDLNGNGIQDTGEPGIDGVSVTLTGTDDRGASVTRTTTTSSAAGSAGGWFIDQLRPGTYRVTFTKAGMVPTATTVAAGTTATDSDVQTNGTTADFTLRANVDLTATASNNRDIDGGLYAPITLGDYVWRDDSLDGLQDPDEPPMRGVTVTLRHAGPDGVFETADDRTLTTVTAADGSYSFVNIAPGNARVIVTKPTGYSHSPRGDAASDPYGGGTGAARDSNVDRTTGSADVTLVSGRNRSDVDAGLIAHGSLGGIVWNDGTGSGDGQRGAGERGEPGITIRLLLPDGAPATDDNGQPLVTLTGADGSYLFEDIVARNYIVAFDVPNAFIVTKRAVGDPNSDSDIDVKTFRTSVITVAPLANVRHVDAGILNPVEPFLVPPSTSAPTTMPPTVTTTKRPNVTISERPPTLDGPASTVAPSGPSTATTSTTATKSPLQTTKPSSGATTVTTKRRGGTIRGQDAQRPDSSSGQRRLALTGTDALRLLAFAGLLTGVGTGLTIAARRRRKSLR